MQTPKDTTRTRATAKAPVRVLMVTRKVDVNDDVLDCALGPAGAPARGCHRAGGEEVRRLGATGGVTPHVLRHTFSYAYLDKTHNGLVGLADILGHDNLATTQKPLEALQDEIEKVRFF